jgi:hypothetical protein
MAGRMADHLFGDGDSYFLPWVLSWVFHHLGSGLWRGGLFDANIFYPAPNSLAFSEHHLSAQLLYAPLYLATGNPVLAYNLVLLLSYVCLGLAMFALVRYLTDDLLAALIAGFIFAFNPVRLFPYPHLQLVLIWWSPLALLFLERDLRRPSWRDFSLFCACFWLQFLSSTYLGMYLATMAVFRAGWAAGADRRSVSMRRMLGRVAMLAVGSAVVLMPFVLPYIETSRQWRYTRSLEENITSSAELASYVSAAPANYLYGRLLSGFSSFRWPKYFFPGAVAATLALLGAWAAVRARSGVPERAARAGPAYLALGVVALMLSLGPFFIWRGHPTDVPLPYLVLYHLAPGYQAMRIPARFGLWVGLAMAVLAGIGCHWLRARFRQRWGRRTLTAAAPGVAAALLIGLVGFEAYTPGRPVPVEVPPVYRFLATEDRAPLVELPMPRVLGPDEVHRKEMERTFYSMYHRRPMVNGYSGFTPPWFDQIASVLNLGPRRDVIRAMAALGVNTIVLHRDDMSESERQAWQGSDLARLGLREVARFGGDRVLKIAAGPAPMPALTADVESPAIVPIGDSVTMMLRLASATDEPRVERMTDPWLDVHVRWTDARGCEAMRSRVAAPMPLVLLSRATQVALVASTPSQPGDYRVAIESRWFSTSRRVTARELFPAPSLRTARSTIAPDPPGVDRRHRPARTFADQFDLAGGDRSRALPHAGPRDRGATGPTPPGAAHSTCAAAGRPAARG